MFRVLGAVTMSAGLLCIVAALWIPSSWWQLALTGVMLLIVGIALQRVKDEQ